MAAYALSGLQKEYRSRRPDKRLRAIRHLLLCRMAASPYPAYKNSIDPVGRISVYAPSGNVFLYLPKYFALQEGGKPEYPRELTEVSDRGTMVQPTHLRRERRR